MRTPTWKWKLVILSGLLCLFGDVVKAFGPKKLYTMDVDTNLVSVNVINRALILTGSYYIGEIENIQWKFAQPTRMKIEMMNTDIADPRYVGMLPYGTLKNTKEPFFWITSWTSNTSDGHVAILKKTKDYSEWKAVDVGTGWSYDRAIWVDMNRDNMKDCLTARYRAGVGQLIYFQQPKGQEEWQQFIVNEGEADGNFKTIQHYKRNYILVAANQFSSLTVFWTSDRKGRWGDAKKLRKSVVDNYGKYYDIQHVDLNNDGRKDILTTTLKVSDSRGHVLGYDLPDDLRHGNWKRHVLASGFDADYSPGKAVAFFPNKYKAKSERPSIFCTGGSSGKIYLLSPRPKTKGWSYVKTHISLSSFDGAVGIPWIGDLNEDSYPEMFIPQGKKLHVFAYDYATSVLEAPASSLVDDAPQKPKTPIKSRSPYYRPGNTPKKQKLKPNVKNTTIDENAVVKPFFEGERPQPSPTSTENANLNRQPPAVRIPNPGNQPTNPVLNYGQPPVVRKPNPGNQPKNPTMTWGGQSSGKVVLPKPRIPPTSYQDGGSSQPFMEENNLPNSNYIPVVPNSQPNNQPSSNYLPGQPIIPTNNQPSSSYIPGQPIISTNNLPSGNYLPGQSMVPPNNQPSGSYLPAQPIAQPNNQLPGNYLPGQPFVQTNSYVPRQPNINPLLPGNNLVSSYQPGNIPQNYQPGSYVPPSIQANNQLVQNGFIIPNNGRSPQYPQVQPVIPLNNQFIGPINNPFAVQPNNQNGVPVNNQFVVQYPQTNNPFSGPQLVSNQQNQLLNDGQVIANSNPVVPVQPVDGVPVFNQTSGLWYMPSVKPPISEPQVSEGFPEEEKETLLKVSQFRFSNHAAANASCLADNRKLCTLRELQKVVKIKSIIPDTLWAWFETPQRAAKLESCIPGEVKFAGYECYNGDVVHSPILNEANLPAFCCAAVIGAIFTPMKHKTFEDAERSCADISHHLCSYEEMVVVRLQSTYQNLDWGWFNSPEQMIRMSSYCNEDSVLWNGYKCSEGLFEMSQIRSTVEESAFCCHGSHAVSHHHGNRCHQIWIAFTLVLLLQMYFH